MRKKELVTPLSEMSPKQLQKGIRRWLNGGATDGERDAVVEHAVKKATTKIAANGSQTK